jgi:hypothetical protein
VLVTCHEAGDGVVRLAASVLLVGFESVVVDLWCVEMNVFG